jgi:hypothetical protein
MGYPYNYEPLNFIRAAGSCICGMFALFQMVALEGMNTLAECTGNITVPDLGDDGGDVLVSCEATFDLRVSAEADPKDEQTCPMGCSCDIQSMLVFWSNPFNTRLH